MLVVLAACAPCQIVQAGMIGTDQAVVPAAGSERGAVLAFMARSDVARELQALGVDPAAARARVAAMTDAEISRVAGNVDAAPAGGFSVIGVAAVLIIIGVIVWAFQK